MNENGGCNFKISVRLIPSHKGNWKFSIMKQTDTYALKRSDDHNQKRYFVFELDDPDNTSSYHFHFDLEEDEGEGDETEDKITQYIELCLYEISIPIEIFPRLSIRYFRGHALVPVDGNMIPRFSTNQTLMEEMSKVNCSDRQFVFTETLDESPNLDRQAYNELTLRSETIEDHVAKSYKKYRTSQHNNCRTIHFTI